MYNKYILKHKKIFLHPPRNLRQFTMYVYLPILLIGSKNIFCCIKHKVTWNKLLSI